MKKKRHVIDDDDVCVSDEDGDLVAFSSDDELIMGLACMKDATFRLFIKGKTPAASTSCLHPCSLLIGRLLTNYNFLSPDVFQRRKSTVVTSLFMPSLLSPLVTLLLLHHLGRHMPRPLTWAHPLPCTPV